MLKIDFKAFYNTLKQSRLKCYITFYYLYDQLVSSTMPSVVNIYYLMICLYIDDHFNALSNIVNLKQCFCNVPLCWAFRFMTQRPVYRKQYLI
jgi:hypothetical protein